VGDLDYAVSYAIEEGRETMGRVVGALFLLLVPAAGLGQAPPVSVRVATRVVKPFVFEEGGELKGFSIDLWQEIGRRLGVKSEFLVKPTVQDLLLSVKSNEAHSASRRSPSRPSASKPSICRSPCSTRDRKS
jgi:hypothetical protein